MGTQRDDEAKFSVRELPVYRHWKFKIGRVVDLWDNGCIPDPEIWVQAFFHDVPTLFWSLFKPDANDLLVARFGGQHKRKPKKTWNLLDAMEGEHSVPKGGATWVMFKSQAIAQRVAWYYMVADVTTDFVINWTSTAMRWDGCNGAATGWAQGTGQPGYQVYHTFDGDPAPCWIDWHYLFPVTMNGSYIECIAGYDLTCGCRLQWDSIPGAGFPDPGKIDKVEMVDYLSGITLATAEPINIGGGRQQASLVFRDWNPNKPPKRMGIRVNVAEPGWFSFAGSSFSGSADPDRGTFADP